MKITHFLFSNFFSFTPKKKKFKISKPFFFNRIISFLFLLLFCITHTNKAIQSSLEIILKEFPKTFKKIQFQFPFFFKFNSFFLIFAFQIYIVIALKWSLWISKIYYFPNKILKFLYFSLFFFFQFSYFFCHAKIFFLKIQLIRNISLNLNIKN